MTFTARLNENGTAKAGPFADGTSWEAISEGSRYWDELLALTNNGADIVLFSVPAPAVTDYQSAIQALVDQTAVSQQYTDGVTLASYAASTNLAWAAQATTFIAWRDQVWAYAYAQFAAVQAGQRPQPSVADLIAELPAIHWSHAEGN